MRKPASPKIEIACRTCGKKFLRIPSRIRTNVYCSRKCAGNGKKGPSWTRQKQKEYNREYMRIWSRTGKYGITLEQLQSMYKQQSGKCAICDVAFNNDFEVRIDHDHDTGKVRGLLCNGCNVVLGRFKSPGLLKSAFVYLEGSTKTGT